MGLVCRRLREVAHTDALWKRHSRSLLPPATFRHLCSWVTAPSWKARYAAWVRVAAAWRGAAGWPVDSERGPAVFSAPASAGGPVFCVNALRSCSARQAPASAGGGRATREDAPYDEAP